jgi:Glycosyl hydrolase catalytic core
MLWTSRSPGDWNTDAPAAIAAGADTLLSFNEPDLAAQSNLDVPTAVAGYKQFMQPFAGKARLGAPAVTNGAAPGGLAWLTSFLSACTGCTIDVVPIHWYDSATNAAYFKSYVAQAYAAGGNRPIWITEFGASGSDDQVEAFFQDVLPWLDAQPYVERYAYFMAAPGLLLDGAGNALSAIGSAYVG